MSWYMMPKRHIMVVYQLKEGGSLSVKGSLGVL